VKPSQVDSEFFFNMSTRMPSDFLLWLIDPSEDFRGLFEPILKSFEHCTPRSFPQLELHRVYNQWPGALSADECHPRRLRCVCETVGSLFDGADTNTKMSLEHNQLMKFFTRWLVLLEPFARFSRVSSEVTGYLQLLFKSIARWVTKLGVDFSEKGNKSRPIHGLFYEFSRSPRTACGRRRTSEVQVADQVDLIRRRSSPTRRSTTR
jgi:hypothetical protein